MPWHCRDMSCTRQAELGQALTRCSSSTSSAWGILSQDPPHSCPAHSCLIYGAGSAGWRHTPRHTTRLLPEPSAVPAWRLLDNPPPARERCWSRGCGGPDAKGEATTALLFSMTTLNNCQWSREGPINTPHNSPGTHCGATTAGHWVTNVPTPSVATPCGTSTVGRWTGGHRPGSKRGD